MNKFYVLELPKDNDFNALVLLTNSDAPLTPISQIEAVIPSLNDGFVLIDQLLHSGNTDERFISLEIIDGKINECTISFYFVSKGSQIRNISRELLFKHDLIEFSTLSSIQKRMLKKGIAI